MRAKRNRFFVTTIAMFFILLLTTPMLLPTTNAHSPPWTINNIAFCTVAPNPVGIGQSVTVGFWLVLPPITAGGPYGDRYQNMTVKVAKPDGTTETLGPFTSDDTGGTSTRYTPTQIGTYTFQMTYGGQTLVGTPTGNSNPAYIGDYSEPATSNVETLTVQQEPVGGLPFTPLPTSYWQTPINALNVHNWYAIGGASLNLGGTGKYNFSSNYNPYTLAPKTAHILWTKPEAFGGVLGGEFGGTTTYGNYYSTAQYERKYNPVIMNGFLYYNVIPGSSTTPTALVCLNLYTGETVWTNDANNLGGGSPAQTALTSSGLVTTLLCGQILDYVSPNQYGGLAYLWTTGTPNGIVSSGTTLNMFDAETGTYILSIVNGTSPSLTEDQNGNLIGYFVNATAGTQRIMGPIDDSAGPTPTIVTTTGPSLNEWNSTACIMASSWSSQASGWQWRPPQNAIMPFANGITWKSPLATNISGAPLPSTLAIRDINSGVIVLGAELTSASFFNVGYVILAGYSSDTGKQLWIENVTQVPYTDIDSSGITFLASNGIFVIPCEETGIVTGYSMNTGAQLWQTNVSPFNPYSSIGQLWGVIANATLFLVGFGGDIWSINMFTGGINWYTNTTAFQGSAETNSPYGTWPIWTQTGGGLADGILFLQEGHEYSPPLFIGAQQLAINTTNGKLVWSIDAFDVNSRPAMAYGIMTTINAYDNQIYAYGMGPSKTTVNAPNPVTTVGSPILIRGTVTDISAGSKQEAVAANFPNELPAVSDDSMSHFMEAVYMQQPLPTNSTGVPVTISVIDSNGNYRQIGRTTSDGSGMFTFTLIPDIPGNYTVIANFGGTLSYYPSNAETSFFASEPAATPTPQPMQSASLADQYILPGIAAIIVVIVVCFAITILLLRKRP